MTDPDTVASDDPFSALRGTGLDMKATETAPVKKQEDDPFAELSAAGLAPVERAASPDPFAELQSAAPDLKPLPTVAKGRAPSFEKPSDAPVYDKMAKAGAGEDQILAYEVETGREASGAWRAFGERLKGMVGLGVNQSRREERKLSDLMDDQKVETVTAGVGSSPVSMPQTETRLVKLSERTPGEIVQAAHDAGIPSSKIADAVRAWDGTDTASLYASVRQLGADEIVKRGAVRERAAEAISRRGATAGGKMVSLTAQNLPYMAEFMLAAPAGPAGLMALVLKEGEHAANAFAADRYEVSPDGEIFKLREGDDPRTAMLKGVARGAVTVGVETAGGRAAEKALGSAAGALVKKIGGEAAAAKAGAIAALGPIKYFTRNMPGGTAKTVLRNTQNVLATGGLNTLPGEWFEELADPLVSGMLGLNEDQQGRNNYEQTMAGLKDFFTSEQQGDTLLTLVGLQAVGGLVGLPVAIGRHASGDKAARRSAMRSFLTTAAGIDEETAQRITDNDEAADAVLALSNLPPERAATVMAGLSDRAAKAVNDANQAFGMREEAKNFESDAAPLAEKAAGASGRLGANLSYEVDDGGVFVTLFDDAGRAIFNSDNLEEFNAKAGEASRILQARDARRTKKAETVQRMATDLGVEGRVHLAATAEEAARVLEQLGNPKEAATALANGDRFKAVTVSNPETGESDVVLVLDNASSPADAARSVFHEMGVHVALARSVGRQGVDAVLDSASVILGEDAERAVRTAGARIVAAAEAEGPAARADMEARKLTPEQWAAERASALVSSEDKRDRMLTLEEGLSLFAEEGIADPDTPNRVARAIGRSIRRDQKIFANVQTLLAQNLREARGGVEFRGVGGNAYGPGFNVLPEEELVPEGAAPAAEAAPAAPVEQAETAQAKPPQEAQPAAMAERQTRHRVFEGGSPITYRGANGLRSQNVDKAYRMTGQAQIDDIQSSGEVRAKAGKMKGGRSGEVHWTRGHESLVYPPVTDGKYVLETSAANLNDRTGGLPKTELSRVFKSVNGEWVDVTDEIKGTTKKQPAPEATDQERADMRTLVEAGFGKPDWDAMEDADVPVLAERVRSEGLTAQKWREERAGTAKAKETPSQEAAPVVEAPAEVTATPEAPAQAEAARPAPKPSRARAVSAAHRAFDAKQPVSDEVVRQYGLKVPDTYALTDGQWAYTPTDAKASEAAAVQETATPKAEEAQNAVPLDVTKTLDARQQAGDGEAVGKGDAEGGEAARAGETPPGAVEQPNRADGAEAVKPPAEPEPPARPSFEIEGAEFAGVQQLPGVPDQHIWRDGQTGATVIVSADAERAEVERRLAEVRQPTEQPRRKKRAAKKEKAAPDSEVKQSGESPLQREWGELKKRNPTGVLAVRLGDFYEFFNEDAETAKTALDLKLTQRNDVKMAGIPYHAFDAYAAKLTQAGHDVHVVDYDATARQRYVKETIPAQTVSSEKAVAEAKAPEPTVSSKVARAEAETAVPTEAQKEAGNYRKGRFAVHGMEIAIENPVGSVRSGVSKEGKPWRTEMRNSYGYFAGEADGKDGDKLDVFLGPDVERAESVYVIDQVDPATGEFDEHKVMLGFPSEEAARAAYESNYQKGWKGLKSITGVSVGEFKAWMGASDRKTKPFADYAAVKAAVLGRPPADRKGRTFKELQTLRRTAKQARESGGITEPKPAEAKAPEAAVGARIEVETAPDGDKTVSVPSKDNPDISPKAQKRYLLAEIDKAIETAPDVELEKAPREPSVDILRADGTSARGEWRKAKDAVLERNKAAHGTVTIEVPGDGTFEVVNAKSSLMELKKGVEKRFPLSISAPKETGPKTAPTAPVRIGKPPAVSGLSKEVRGLLEPFVSTDKTRPALLSPHWNGVAGEAVATDGRRMAVLLGEKNAEVTPAPKGVERNPFDNYHMVVPGYRPGELPDRTGSLIVKADSERLSRQLAQVKALHKDVETGVPNVTLMLTKEGSLEIESDQIDTGSYSSLNGRPGFPLGVFNADYLTDAVELLRKTGSAEIALLTPGPNAPLLLTGDRAYVVQMPMNLTGARNYDGAPERYEAWKKEEAQPDAKGGSVRFRISSRLEALAETYIKPTAKLAEESVSPGADWRRLLAEEEGAFYPNKAAREVFADIFGPSVSEPLPSAMSREDRHAWEKSEYENNPGAVDALVGRVLAARKSGARDLGLTPGQKALLNYAEVDAARQAYEAALRFEADPSDINKDEYDTAMSRKALVSDANEYANSLAGEALGMAAMGRSTPDDELSYRIRQAQEAKAPFTPAEMVALKRQIDELFARNAELDRQIAEERSAADKARREIDAAASRKAKEMWDTARGIPRDVTARPSPRGAVLFRIDTETRERLRGVWMRADASFPADAAPTVGDTMREFSGMALEEGYEPADIGAYLRGVAETMRRRSAEEQRDARRGTAGADRALLPPSVPADTPLTRAVRAAVLQASRELPAGASYEEGTARGIEILNEEGVYVGLTPSEFQREWAGVGKTRADNRDEAEKREWNWRQAARYAERIADLAKGIAPVKAQTRQAMTIETRKLAALFRREFAEAVRERRLPDSAIEEAMVTAVGAVRRGLENQIEALEDAIGRGEAMPEPARALKDDDRTLALRERVRELRAMYDKLPAVEARHRVRELTAAKSAETRKQNIIEQKRADLAAGLLPARQAAPQGIEPDEELAAERAETARLREAYKAELRANPEMQERMLNETLDGLQASLDAIEADIEAGVGAAPSEGKPMPDARVLKLREAIRKGKVRMRQIWDDAHPAETLARKEEAKATRLKRSIAELRRKMALGLYSPKVRAPDVVTPLTLRLEAEKREVRRAYEEEARQFNMRRRRIAVAGFDIPVGRVLVADDVLAKFFKSARAMLDVSGAFVQNAPLSAALLPSLPEHLHRAISAAISDPAYLAFIEAKKASPLYDEFVANGGAGDVGPEELTGGQSAHDMGVRLSRSRFLPLRAYGKAMTASSRVMSALNLDLRLHAYKILRETYPDATEAEKRAFARTVNVLGGYGDTKWEGAFEPLLTRFMWSNRNFSAQVMRSIGFGGILGTAGLKSEDLGPRRHWYESTPGALKLHFRAVAGALALKSAVAGLAYLLRSLNGGDDEPYYSGSWDDEDTFMAKLSAWFFGPVAFGDSSIDFNGRAWRIWQVIGKLWRDFTGPRPAHDVFGDLGQFVRQRVGPWHGMQIELAEIAAKGLSGKGPAKNAIGEPASIGDFIPAPMSVKQAYEATADAFQQYGVWGLLAAPVVLGATATGALSSTYPSQYPGLQSAHDAKMAKWRAAKKSGDAAEEARLERRHMLEIDAHPELSALEKQMRAGRDAGDDLRVRKAAAEWRRIYEAARDRDAERNR